jgi:hypothetical protein
MATAKTGNETIRRIEVTNVAQINKGNFIKVKLSNLIFIIVKI